MGKPSPKKLERKRKSEAKRNAQRHPRVSLAYHGNKYRREEFVPFQFETEKAICQAYVMLDRRLSDRQVRLVLERLIHKLRQGRLDLEEVQTGRNASAAGDLEFVEWWILNFWHDYFQDAPLLGRDTITGILRSILGSVEHWGSPYGDSRGYLQYLEGFLTKLGFSVESLTEAEFRERFGDSLTDELTEEDPSNQPWLGV